MTDRSTTPRLRAARLPTLVGTAALCAVAAIACTAQNPRYCATSDDCDDGQRCDPDRHECLPGEPADAADAAHGDRGIDASGLDAPTVDANSHCADQSDCTDPTTPICDLDTGACRACAGGSTGDQECVAQYPAEPLCAQDGRCVSCIHSASDCSEPTAPICDATTGDCRACSPSGSGDADCDARNPDEPRCAEDGTCVQCVADGDCDSTICTETTALCVETSQVVYVATEGTDTSSCGSDESPCATIGHGVSRSSDVRRYIKIGAGGYGESVVIDGANRHLVGPGAVIDPPIAAADQPALLVDNRALVVVEGMTLQGAIGGSGADGVRCESSSSVGLVNVTIAGNGDAGLEATSCTVTLRESTVRENGGTGVLVFGGGVWMTRSTVAENDGGGLAIRDADLLIENNFIVGNGEAGASGSAFGGVQISSSLPGSTQVFRFNTVADSQAKGSAFASGVICQTSTPMTADNNIVYAGIGAAATIAGDCTWAYSNVEGGAEGTANLDRDPRFVDPAAEDYHLQGESPCRDAADPAAETAIDFDGHPRPEGDAPDIGADEIAAGA